MVKGLKIIKCESDGTNLICGKGKHKICIFFTAYLSTGIYRKLKPDSFLVQISI